MLFAPVSNYIPDDSIWRLSLLQWEAHCQCIPEIDDKLVEKAFELFDKIRGEMQALTVQNRQQTAELQAKLVQGTGLSADEFKPLTLFRIFKMGYRWV